MHNYVLMLKLHLFFVGKFAWLFGFVFSCFALERKHPGCECAIQEGACESATKHIFSAQNVPGARIPGQFAILSGLHANSLAN